jgi:hypothetical protein
MNRDQLSYKLSENNTFQDVMDLLKQSVMMDTHVATLAFFDSVIQEYTSDNKYGIIRARPFPLRESESEYGINAYYINDRTFEQGQILVILYTDLCFAENLQTDKRNPRKTKNTMNHSMLSGVVIL